MEGGKTDCLCKKKRNAKTIKKEIVVLTFLSVKVKNVFCVGWGPGGKRRGATAGMLEFYTFKFDM